MKSPPETATQMILTQDILESLADDDAFIVGKITVYFGNEAREADLYRKKKNGAFVYWSPFTGERIKFHVAGHPELVRESNNSTQEGFPKWDRRPSYPDYHNRKVLEVRAKKPRRIKTSKTIPSFREQLYEKQDGFCFYCGKITAWELWTVDHRQPISRNGTNDKNDRVGACWSCNNAKGNMTESEFLRSEFLVTKINGA
jgi:5-methylcytosine-specific restriction endonuclease McrA